MAKIGKVKLSQDNSASGIPVLTAAEATELAELLQTAVSDVETLDAEKFEGFIQMTVDEKKISVSTTKTKAVQEEDD